MCIAFSVVIPVYNTPRKFLEKCVASALLQNYSDKEIIIVNDGSSTEETLRYLEGVNGHGITVIHKPNSGQASARNVGMDAATGDYVMFLDSDDYYMTLELFSSAATLLGESHADMLSFSYREFFDEANPPTFKKGTLPRARVLGRSRESAWRALLGAGRNVFSSVLHNKIIRLGLMRENDIRFIEGVHNEDTYVTACLVRAVRTIDRYDYEAYAFRRNNPNSLTTSSKSAVKIVCDMGTVFDALRIGKDGGERELYNFLSSPFAFWMGKVANFSPGVGMRNAYPEIWQSVMDMLKYRFVLKYATRNSVRLVALCVRIFGILPTIALMRAYFTLNSKHQLSIKRRMK